MGFEYSPPDAATLVSDEGVPQGAAVRFNFTGTGVTVTVLNGVATVNIPGGLSSLPVSQFVRVDATFGNNATGLVNRFDKPFLTWAAADAAVLAGLTPTSSNPVLFLSMTGFYNESIKLRNNCNYDLGISVIDFQTVGIGGSIIDNNVAVNCTIFGSGKITNSLNSFGSSLRIENAATIINIFGDQMSCTVPGGFGGSIIDCSGTVNVNCLSIDSIGGTMFNSLNTGNITITCPSIKNNSSNNTMFSGNGTITINGNVTQLGAGGSGDSVINMANGSFTLNGNITAPELLIDQLNSGGKILINGNVNVTAGDLFNRVVGNVRINGDITCPGGSATNFSGVGTVIINDSTITASSVMAFTGTGRLKIISSTLVISAGNNDCISQSGANIFIIQDCTLLPHGTGKDISTGSTITLYGANQTPVLVPSVHTELVGIITRDINVS